MMATTRLLSSRCLFRLGATTCAGSTSVFLHRSMQRPILCEALNADGLRESSKTPIMKDGNLNPQAITQFSSGTVLGILAGLAASSFSRTLAGLFGLTLFALQWLASRGYVTINYATLQKWVRGINLRRVVEDNVAFKLSFGAAFALAAFAPSLD